MGDGPADDRAGDLAAAVRRLAAAAEQVVALQAESARLRDEYRAEAKQRRERFDAEHEEFRQRQKRWDDQDKRGGLGTSTLLFQAVVLLVFVALAALAVAQCIQASRR